MASQASHKHGHDNPSKKTKGVSVLVVASDGSEEIETITPYDVLKRAGAEVTMAACNTANDEKLIATLSRGVRVLCDTTIDEASNHIDTYSAIVIPGGMPGSTNLHASKVLKQILEEKIKDPHFIVSSICAAPYVVLAQHGILKDVPQATVFPSYAEKMGSIFVEDRVVVSKSGSHGATVVTSRGPGTALEFSLKLVELLFDGEKSEQISKAMLAPTLAAKA